MGQFFLLVCDFLEGQAICFLKTLGTKWSQPNLLGYPWKLVTTVVSGLVYNLFDEPTYYVGVIIHLLGTIDIPEVNKMAYQISWYFLFL